MHWSARCSDVFWTKWIISIPVVTLNSILVLSHVALIVLKYRNFSKFFQREQMNFYRFTVRYWIYTLFTHQQMQFLLHLEKFKFIWNYT